METEDKPLALLTNVEIKRARLETMQIKIPMQNG